MILLQLLEAGVIREALLTVSPWFEDRRAKYQDQLRSVSQNGDHDTRVRFFAKGLGDQAQQTVARIEALIEFAEHVRRTVTEIDIRGTGRRVAEDLMANPVVWSAAIKTRHGVSYVAANNAVATWWRLVSSKKSQDAGTTMSSCVPPFTRSWPRGLGCSRQPQPGS